MDRLYSRAESQVSHSLRDISGQPLLAGRRYQLTCAGHKPLDVMVVEDETNFDLWFRPVALPEAQLQRVDSLAADADLQLVDQVE